MSNLSQKNRLGIWLFSLAVLIVLPIISFAGSSKKLYVDDGASGTQNGSSKHPYKTITEALKHADSDTEIFVRSGYYKENIEVPHGVELIGEGKSKVTIEAKDDDEATVELENKTKLTDVTIKDGKNGIKISSDKKVLVYNCLVKDAKKDGIRIESDGTSDKNKVTISHSEIKDSGWAGIYAKKRNVALEENYIHHNDGDGIDLSKNSKIWLDDNEISRNDGSGLLIKIDGSEVYTKNNNFYKNGREGIQVETEGKDGRVTIYKSKFSNNDNYGIARIGRGGYYDQTWRNSLTIYSNNSYYSNGKGSVSPLIKVN